MSSKKLTRARAAAGDAMKMDMSPMIDMVFLLLIFFMIASQMITIKMDPAVLPPVADQSVRSSVYKGRFVVNIYEDGTFKEAAFPLGVAVSEVVGVQVAVTWDNWKRDACYFATSRRSPVSFPASVGKESR